MVKKYFFVTLLSALLIFSVCAAVLPAGPAGTGQKAITAGNSAFAFSLYGQLKDQKGNIFFSPYSISTALAMTYLGARGTTASEMAKVLHFTLDQKALHPAFGALIKDLNDRGSKETYELVVANRLWGQKGYRFIKAFLDDEKKYYGSSLEELDFRKETEKSRVAINTWVEKQTRDKIRDLIQKGILTPETSLVLTNAIYFKSPWEEAFMERLTKKEPFSLNRNKKIEVPMMNRTAHFGYGKTGDIEIAEIPYQNGELSMVVLLPRHVEGLSKVEASLTYDKLRAMLMTMASKKLQLALPKFKTTSSFSLGGTLKKMGMNSAFTFGPADFSGMDGTRKLYISEVVHKAFVDVNEKGTEAAAATAVVMRAGSAAPMKEEILPFKVDRPFIFLITDRKSGSILFMGRIQNPAE